MPRGNSPQVPSYRLHKPTGLAVIRLNGHDVYLGKHGTQDSQDKYKRAIAEWLAGKRLVPNAAPTALNGRGQVTVSELVLAYWDFAARYYVKNGRCTGETDNIRYALRPLTTLYGRVCADEFGPNALKAVRQQMIDGRLCRTVVNGRVNRIRRMFKWGWRTRWLRPRSCTLCRRWPR